jgi:chorismate mutase/prephenate dehydratase
MDDLDEIRRGIDDTDAKILELLALRRELANRVIQAKSQQGIPLRDPAREQDLLARRIASGRARGLDGHYVTRVFHEIIDDSVRSQERFLIERANADRQTITRVGFQGIEGAYSQLAAQKYFAKEIDRVSFIGYSTFEDVAEAVEQKDVDQALLPVENTTAGSINEVYDLLSRTHLSVVGEEVFPVDHCLLAVEDVPLKSIRRVVSHPMALAQCMKFLSKLQDCKLEPYTDTAMAARRVQEERDPTQAAIASEEAGKRYGLKILKRNLADQRNNHTRFVVVAPKPINVDLRIPCKTSLVLSVSHEEGALLKALLAFHEHKLNMTKLESRPRPEMPFQYLFYVDFEGNLADPNVESAIAKVRSTTTSLKVLGSYPSHERARTTPTIQSLLPPQPAERAPGGGPETAAAADDAGKKPAKKSKASYKLASRENKDEDTVIEVKGVRIGGPEFVVIAGPCSVESREQILSCARQVKECGGRVLRGGCFKPRTSPYSFQGLGYEGLELLVEAGREYDLPIITEVLSPTDVEAVARVADILQVGARNMQNFSLLNEVGRTSRPVMLKRGMMATIDELLNAAEYILGQGNHQVMLCERGIRTFETSTRNTLDLGAVPLLKRLTHLPIVVDPSHAAGQRDLVIPLALAARAVGPHAMMVEIHPDPEKALSDGPQALRYGDFAELMRRVYEG